MGEKFINIDTITSLELLSQLALSSEEQKHAMADLENMVAFVHKMQEVDTNGEDPRAHIFSMWNVFREDNETTEPASENSMQSRMLANAPARKGDFYEVPRTI